ncbi:MAG: cob(I)yrinic acid a,c-diamide adenosyltransferase [Prevotella sp.]|nr:cob(I)yrinic acid a,c-diamide adenosyltransferase [Prevotella sp.]
MKITTVYTRRGDQGMTDLVGGVRISKTDIRLEAYGTIDELSSHLGLLAAQMPATDEERTVIIRIQNNLFNIGTHLATDQSQTPLYASARLAEGETAFLEQRIDAINALLPEPQGFVLPGGTTTAAQCHVCRTVCRRAERAIDALAEKAKVGPDIIEYVNRLSDYLFVLAKIINFNAGQQEIIWKNACK